MEEANKQIFCPVCQQKEAIGIGEKNGFEVFECKVCCSLYTQPLTKMTADFDYSEYYEEINLSVPEFVNQSLNKVIKKFDVYRKGNHLLDVSCGAGILLKIAQANQWNVEGVEVSSSATANLRKEGLKVFHGTLVQAKFPDGYFDIVTATEVIEHIDNASELLKEIARIIRPGGLLWLTTPHAQGLSARLLGVNWSIVCPPEHLHIFSLLGMGRTLRENGFKKIKFATHGVNPFEIYQHILKKNKKVRESTREISIYEPEFDRVKTGYQLNHWLSSKTVTKGTKTLINLT